MFSLPNGRRPTRRLDLLLFAAPLFAAPLFAVAACADRTSAVSTPSASTSTGRIFVDAAVSGGNGSSWTAALSDLQEALAVAQHGDEIWVKAGVYRPAPPGADRRAHFALKTNVALYGGFDGTETRLEQRDPGANRTELSGDLEGNDQPGFVGRADNAYQVVVAVDVLNPRLDGFVVSGGHADGPGLGPTPDSLDQGAGLNVYHSTPAVVGCVFEDNFDQNHGAVNDHGASLIEDCTFRRNRSDTFGGGLYLHHDARTTVRGCVFEDNEAQHEGAGLYCRSMFGPIVEDCCFRGNTAERGGGMYVAEMANPTIVGCMFVDNNGLVGGGGVYSDLASPTIRECTYVRNQAGLQIPGGSAGGGGSGGGGVWTTGGAAVVEGCFFGNNVASLGAGVYCIEDAFTTVVDCVFEDNLATEAGGLYVLTSPATVLDCEFTRNVALGGPFSVGGAVSNYFSDARIEGCLFRHNRAELGGGGLYNEGAVPIVRRCRFEGNETFGVEGWGGGLLNGFFTLAIVDDCTFVGNRANVGGGVHDMAFSDALTVNCTLVGNKANEASGVYGHALTRARWINCIVWGSGPASVSVPADFLTYSCVQGGWPGAGNTRLDPRFVREPHPGADATFGTADDDYGDLHLRAGSPALDAGSSSALPAGIEVDLDGAPRFVDDPAPDTGIGRPIVDQGAYERDDS